MYSKRRVYLRSNKEGSCLYETQVQGTKVCPKLTNASIIYLGTFFEEQKYGYGTHLAIINTLRMQETEHVRNSGFQSL